MTQDKTAREEFFNGAYNDIKMWNYACRPDVFGGRSFAKGLHNGTEEKLDQAFQDPLANPGNLFFPEALISERDCSRGLKKLGGTFRD